MPNQGNLLSSGHLTEAGPCCQEKVAYTPKKGELLRQHGISIQFLNVGVIVNVGCKSIAFSTVCQAMEAINAYVNNPIIETERWDKVFKENK